MLRNADAKESRAVVDQLREILQAPEVIQALERSRTDLEIEDGE
jgi:hypothetical protein